MAKLQFKLWVSNGGYGDNFYAISEEDSDWEEMGYAYYDDIEIEIDEHLADVKLAKIRKKQRALRIAKLRADAEALEKDL